MTQRENEPDRSVLRAGGVPEPAIDAWVEAMPTATGVFADDARSHGVFWRLCDELVGHLPGKPGRTPAQAKAADAIFARAREMRERFLRAHVEPVYAAVTHDYSRFVRLEELVFAAADAARGWCDARAGRRRSRAAAARQGGPSRSTRASSSPHVLGHERPAATSATRCCCRGPRREAQLPGSRPTACSISARRASSGRAAP